MHTNLHVFSFGSRFCCTDTDVHYARNLHLAANTVRVVSSFIYGSVIKRRWVYASGCRGKRFESGFCLTYYEPGILYFGNSRMDNTRSITFVERGHWVFDDVCCNFAGTINQYGGIENGNKSGGNKHNSRRCRSGF